MIGEVDRKTTISVHSIHLSGLNLENPTSDIVSFQFYKSEIVNLEFIVPGNPVSLRKNERRYAFMAPHGKENNIFNLHTVGTNRLKKLLLTIDAYS